MAPAPAAGSSSVTSPPLSEPSPLPLKKPRRLTSPFVFTEVAALASQLVADGIEPVGSSSSDEACLRRAMHALAAQVVRNLSAKLLIARGQRHAAYASQELARCCTCHSRLQGRGGIVPLLWPSSCHRRRSRRVARGIRGSSRRASPMIYPSRYASSPAEHRAFALTDRPRPLSPHAKAPQQEQQRSKLQRRWTARQPENKVYLAPQTPPQRTEQTFQQPSGRRRRQKKPRQQRSRGR